MRTRRSPRNQERLFQSIGQELAAAAIRERLFIGKYPCAIVYADRHREENGDYKRLATLPYRTLVLNVRPDCPPQLAAAIRRDAAGYKAGTTLQVSTAGQTVMLGTD